jgi:hypothetical protein
MPKLPNIAGPSFAVLCEVWDSTLCPSSIAQFASLQGLRREE